MTRRLFLKFAGLLPLTSVLYANNALGMSHQLTSIGIKRKRVKSMSDIFEGNFSPRLIVVAGRPSMGKTAVMLNLLNDISVALGESAVYFSLEMSKESLVNRLMAIHSGVSNSSIRSGSLGSEDWSAKATSARAISDSKIFFDDSAGISVEEIRRRVESHQQKDKSVKFVFVDYFQLIGAEKKYQSRRSHVEDILKQLRAMARDLKIVVIAAGQLNRGVEGRNNRRPLPEDLREVQDISAIDELLLLYRERYYNKSISSNVIEIVRFDNRLTNNALWVGDMAIPNQKISNFKAIT